MWREEISTKYRLKPPSTWTPFGGGVYSIFQVDILLDIMRTYQLYLPLSYILHLQSSLTIVPPEPIHNHPCRSSWFGHKARLRRIATLHWSPCLRHCVWCHGSWSGGARARYHSTCHDTHRIGWDVHHWRSWGCTIQSYFQFTQHAMHQFQSRRRYWAIGSIANDENGVGSCIIWVIVHFADSSGCRRIAFLHCVVESKQTLGSTNSGARNISIVFTTATTGILATL